ncbi:MAG: NifB/NifX family molybdenum-iron cluster-binding protein [Acidobacteriota bacterium]|jgi:predicted Fe-Mo cluster-binding NifX family protein
MAIAAFACWKDRIAPVFDTARRLHIVEARSGKVIRETTETLEDTKPFRLALRMAELQPDVLVCGAISVQIQNLITAYGIRIVPFKSGQLPQVIAAWKEGSLERGAFAMPGCGSRRRRRRGRGGGRGTGNGRRGFNPR